MTVLLPDLTLNNINDRGYTFLTVLANMGYFGQLPANEISSIKEVSSFGYFQNVRSMEIAYNYDADGLPTTYDTHFQLWKNELPHLDADNNMTEEQTHLVQELKMQGFYVLWEAQSITR